MISKKKKKKGLRRNPKAFSGKNHIFQRFFRPKTPTPMARRSDCQRWSRGHKARGQDQRHKKIQGQGQTLSRPMTGMLEAKSKDTSASALHRKKKGLHKNFSGDLKKKKWSSQKFVKRSPQKNVFQKIFQALHKILTIQKIVLSSSRGQHYFLNC